MLTLAAHPATGAAPDLVVLVWCAPGTTVGALGRRGVGHAHTLALWNHAARPASGQRPGSRRWSSTATRGPRVTARRSYPCTTRFPRHARWPFLHRRSTVAAACGADELGIDPPRPGHYPAWTVPALAPGAPWCDELLRAVSAAHRATLEAHGRGSCSTLAGGAPAEARAVVAVRQRELRELHDRIEH